MWVLSSLRARTQVSAGSASRSRIARRGRRVAAWSDRARGPERPPPPGGPRRPTHWWRGSVSPTPAGARDGIGDAGAGPRLGELHEHDELDAVGWGQQARTKLCRAGPGRPAGSVSASLSSQHHCRWRSGGGSGPALAATQHGQECQVVSPHPGKAVLTVTDTSPVACSAAVMPGELSTMTLSPKIHTLYGFGAVGRRDIEVDVALAGARGGRRVRRRRRRPPRPSTPPGRSRCPSKMTAAVATTPSAAMPGARNVHAAAAAPPSRPAGAGVRSGSSWRRRRATWRRAGRPAAATPTAGGVRWS